MRLDLIIPMVALAIDRLIFWVHKELFPHRYGGAGVLNHLLRMALNAWEDVKTLLWRPAGAAEPAATQPKGTQPEGGTS